MADYSIIADTSNFLLKVLREKMCPEPIPSTNNIQISSPASQDVDYLVGVYLYDIKEEADIAHPAMIRRGSVTLQRPPRPFGLYYMVFINGGSQAGLKDLDIQKIVGKVLQIVNDNSSVSPNTLQPWLDQVEPPIVISQARLTMEEKQKVWSGVNKPYQLSLFFKASPVLVSSEVTIDTPVVTDATFKINNPLDKEEKWEGAR